MPHQKYKWKILIIIYSPLYLKRRNYLFLIDEELKGNVNYEAKKAIWSSPDNSDTYYSSDKKILKKFKRVLKRDQYALTLHTGANLITSFVRTEDVFIYINLKIGRRIF